MEYIIKHNIRNEYYENLVMRYAEKWIATNHHKQGCMDTIINIMAVWSGNLAV